MSPTTITLLFLVFAIISFILEKIPLGLTATICAVGLTLTKVLEFKDAFAGFINSNVVLCVGMFVVGQALFETGMANKIGGIVTKFAKTEKMLIIAIMVIVGMLGTNPNPIVLLLVIFVVTCALTNFMSNTATTALMVPIAVSLAQSMGADPRAVVIATVIAGSCAYATPIGMPANTMVSRLK